MTTKLNKIRFECDAPIRGFYKDDAGKPHVQLVISDTKPDTDDECVHLDLLKSFRIELKKGTIPLIRNHKETFPIGVFVDGKLEKTDGDNHELIGDVALDDRYVESQILYEDVEKGRKTWQASIGGYIDFSVPDAVTYEECDGRYMRVLRVASLDHVAVTRKNRAANPRTRFVGAVRKSMETAFAIVAKGDGESPEWAQAPGGKAWLEKSPAPTVMMEGTEEAIKSLVDKVVEGIGNKFPGVSTQDPGPGHRDQVIKQGQDDGVGLCQTEEDTVKGLAVLTSALSKLMEMAGPGVVLPGGFGSVEDFLKSLEGKDQETVLADMAKAMDAIGAKITKSVETKTDAVDPLLEVKAGVDEVRKGLDAVVETAKAAAINAVAPNLEKATSGVAEIQKSITDTVKAAVADAIKPLSEQVTALEKRVSTISKSVGSQALSGTDQLDEPGVTRRVEKSSFTGMLFPKNGGADKNPKTSGE